MDDDERNGSVAAGHIPVMLDEVVEYLGPALTRADSVVVDATVGLGGHSAALLERTGARLVGIDRDAAALALARQRLQSYASRVCLWHGPYDHIAEALESCGHGPDLDAVLFDFGVSSLQLDDRARGFSYSQDTDLDMRMDQAGDLTAADVVNGYSREALVTVFRELGEERFSGRIATAIVRRRERAPITRSAELSEIVAAAVPSRASRSGHPAKRVFQALRIEVNDELSIIDAALPAALSLLRVGGRAAVLSYHSLEDRRVKRLFANAARPLGPDGAPLPSPAGDPTLRLLTRGAQKPTATEIEANPRAASARLRVAEKVKAGSL